MKYLLTSLCVLAVAVCLTANVYAETQSVKVSGDLTVRGLARETYTFVRTPQEADVTRVGIQDKWQDWYMSATEVQVDADLTDNVSTTVRLVNQRDWNVATVKAATAVSNVNTDYTYGVDEFDVGVDLAYVALKDFIYQPLTLTVGRQDLWFGKGFIVGANQQDPTGTITANEYTVINSFDAFKAVLDYQPWTITGVYSKITENAIQADDGVDLYGVNVGYVFDQYNADIEGYWFWKSDNSLEVWGPIKSDNEVYTIGMRGSADPIEDLTLNLEGAWQCGQYVGHKLQINNRERSAFAIDASAEWRYLQKHFAWKPKIGAEYIVYSGNDAEDRPQVAAGNYEGWDPMYRGKFDSAIREFIGRYYVTAAYPLKTDRAALDQASDASYTNQQQFIIRGSLEPVESLMLEANYNVFWTVEDMMQIGGARHSGLIGQEVDVQATWDYTEDVSFGLLTAWFIPNGDIYYGDLNDHATDIVGTMKVSF